MERSNKERGTAAPHYMWTNGILVSGRAKLLCVLKNTRGALTPVEGNAALCRNQEHPEKLIKTLPSDYTRRMRIASSRALLWHSLLRGMRRMGGILPSRTAKGSQRTKGLTAQPGLQLLAPPPPSGGNCCAIFQRLRQLTGKEKKRCV